METRLQKKPEWGSYIVQTLYRSYKDNIFLFTWRKAATNVSCMPDWIHCETHIRKTFYCANDMKELFQKNEMNNVKWMTLHYSFQWININKSKGIFRTKFLLQTISRLEIFRQNLILSTSCSSTRSKKTPKKQPFFLLDNSLQINFQRNQILSTNSFSSNKFQHNRPLFILFFNLIWH